MSRGNYIWLRHFSLFTVQPSHGIQFHTLVLLQGRMAKAALLLRGGNYISDELLCQLQPSIIEAVTQQAFMFCFLFF